MEIANEALAWLRALWFVILILINGVMAIELFDKLSQRKTNARNYVEMIIFIIEFLILTWLCWFNN